MRNNKAASRRKPKPDDQGAVIPESLPRHMLTIRLSEELFQKLERQSDRMTRQEGHRVPMNNLVIFALEEYLP